LTKIAAEGDAPGMLMIDVTHLLDTDLSITALAATVSIVVIVIQRLGRNELSVRNRFCAFHRNR